MSERILQFFAHEHLPPPLAEVSRPFGELARKLVQLVPPNAEATVALRKLLEAKDAAVRAVLYREPNAGAQEGREGTEGASPVSEAGEGREGRL